MKNGMKAFTGIVIALVLSACNNFFHDLIPPDENFILSFEMDGQLGAAVISGDTVSAVVDKETDIHSVIPRIKVSNKASLLPVTFDYISAAFPNADLIEIAMKMNRSADITSLVTELIKENKDFAVPALDIPIDFTGPVTMLVVSGQGNIRQYTVEITVDTGEPRLLNFSFGKYDNEELVSDASCMINEADRTVTATAMYPIEMDYLSYILVPSFQIQGDSLAIDDLPVVSGITKVQFTRVLGSQNKTIMVTRNGEIKDYTLTITFAEDPDTIRSITDFRFNRAENPGIAANAVASIINTDDTGTISVQVFYQGAKPSTLAPRFISPGIVSVGGVTQANGSSGHDFSSQIEYRVVSRNGMYTRIYTVKVEFISLTDGAPRITAFRFSAALNGELAQDANAQISDGLILIDARYGGVYPPISLVPEFSAEGLVTVYGSVQVSGASPQDFTRQIKYTVTNPLNPLFTRDYWIQCRMIMDTSSAASITSFGFYPEDNDGLADEVIGKIDQINGKITVYAPVGSGVTTRIMSSRFTAAGQVNVEGTAQVSGVSGRVFDAPVTYTVVSANGVNSRSYVVTVRELQSTIYVDYNAFGYGDGTSWTNAFRSLKAACEAAVLFPEDTPKEIWIAAGTYKPGNTVGDYFPLIANTSYIGGFAGWETAKSQRNVAANAVTISGDLGGGLYAKRLFAENAALNGDLSFENMRLTGVRGEAGSCINAILNAASEITVADCDFSNIEASGTGGAVYVRGGGAVISGSVFSACNNGAVYIQGTGARISDVEFLNCDNGNVVRLDCAGDTEITRVIIEDSSGTAFYLGGNGNKTLETVSVKRGGGGVNVQNSAGNLRVDGLILQDINGIGINMNGANGIKRLSSVTALNISGSAINSSASSGSFTLTGNSAFDNTGIISITNGSGAVSVSDTQIKNSKGASALSVTASGNIVIDAVTIDGVPNGRGMYITNNGRADISNTVIKNCVNTGRGGGIGIEGFGSTGISNTVINNCVSTANGGGISIDGSGNANISYVTITGCTVGGNLYGGGMYLANSGAVSVSDTTIDTSGFINIGAGGGIYRSNGSLKVENSVIKNITGANYTANSGIHYASSANLEISGLELQNIPGNGIIDLNSGIKKFSGITASGIGGDYGVYSTFISNGSFTLSDSKFYSCGVYCSASGVEVPIQITDTEIRGAKGSSGLYARTGNAAIAINRVTIDGVPNGRGIYADSNGTILIYNSIIKNCVANIDPGGGGIYMRGTGNKEISGSTISGNTAGNGGGVYTDQGTLTLNSSTISGNIAINCGGGVFTRSETTMNSGTISGNIANGISQHNYYGGAGGGVEVYMGTLTMNGGTISGNTSEDRGGGVYVVIGTITKTGGTIYGSDGGANANTCKSPYGGHAVNIGNGYRSNTTLGPTDNGSW